MVGEGLVTPGVVDAYAKDLGVQSIELLHAVSECAHFLGADTCEGAGEKG